MAASRDAEFLQIPNKILEYWSSLFKKYSYLLSIYLQIDVSNEIANFKTLVAFTFCLCLSQSIYDEVLKINVSLD